MKNFLYLGRFFFFMTMVVLMFPAFAQEDDVSQYLDDGGISLSKNILKVNLANVLIGEVPVSYERILGDAFGLEVGGAYILPYYGGTLLDEFTGNYHSGYPSSGKGFMVSPRYYMGREAPEKRHIGLQYRRRFVSYSNLSSEVRTDFSLVSGSQWVLGNRFVLDMESGLAYSIVELYDAGMLYRASDITFQVSLKTGILF